MMVSDCCGAPASWADGLLDSGICPLCREHCEYVDDESEKNEPIEEPTNPKDSNGGNQTHEIQRPDR